MPPVEGFLDGETQLKREAEVKSGVDGGHAPRAEDFTPGQDGMSLQAESDGVFRNGDVGQWVGCKRRARNSGVESVLEGEPHSQPESSAGVWETLDERPEGQ